MSSTTSTLELKMAPRVTLKSTKLARRAEESPAKLVQRLMHHMDRKQTLVFTIDMNIKDESVSDALKFATDVTRELNKLAIRGSATASVKDGVFAGVRHL